MFINHACNGIFLHKRKEKNKMKKTLSPKLDVVFQALFGEVGSERITKSFLETILNKKIEKIDLSKNPILRREFKDDKLGVLDILAELDGKEKCNIEMQVIDSKSVIERILYYWSRLYSRQIKIGQEYSLLERTIIILITDFKIEGLEELDYHSTWKIIETKGRKRILTEKLEIDIIELPKIEGKEKESSKLLDWLYFLENPKSRRVTEKMEESKEIKEAVEKLDSLSEDERMQRIADLREKAILDEKAIYAKGLDDGIKAGEEKLKKEKLEIAKKLKNKEISINEIAEITGLSKETIEKL
jgi:predicted transposase/invertase (TIGR01784 family)